MPPKKVTQPKKDVKDTTIEINMDNVGDMDENQLRSALQDEEQCNFAFQKLNEIFVSCEDEIKLINTKRDHIVNLLKVTGEISAKYTKIVDDYNTSDYSDEATNAKLAKKSEDEEAAKTKPKKAAAKKVPKEPEVKTEDQSHSLEETKKPAVKKTNKKPAAEEHVEAEHVEEETKKPAPKKPAVKKASEEPHESTDAATTSTEAPKTTKKVVKKTPVVPEIVEHIEEPTKKAPVKKAPVKKATEAEPHEEVEEQPVEEKKTVKKVVAKKAEEPVEKPGPKKAETGTQKKTTVKK